LKKVTDSVLFEALTQQRRNCRDQRKLYQFVVLPGDERMGKPLKHSDAQWCPSKLVTIGLLDALKGGFFRAFYRWLKRDFEHLFVELPDRTHSPFALEAPVLVEPRGRFCESTILTISIPGISSSPPR
jgi:hypothetical protein